MNHRSKFELELRNSAAKGDSDVVYFKVHTAVECNRWPIAHLLESLRVFNERFPCRVSK